MDENIEIFLKGKMSKSESTKFLQSLKDNKLLREEAISSALLLKALRKVGRECDQEIIFELYDDIIDAYFKGMLTEEESQEFKSLLEVNITLRERTIAKAILLKSLKKVGRVQDKNIIKEIKNKENHSNTINFIVKFSVSIAACICILFGIDYQIAKNDTLALSNKYTFVLNESGIDGEYKGVDYNAYNYLDFEQYNIELELDSIFQNVRNNEFVTQNINSLSKHYISSQSETYNEYVNFREEISFYLALSYLQDNNREKAIEILSNLVEYNPEFREANELLHEIKKIKGLW
jgi:hypothetical protein